MVTSLIGRNRLVVLFAIGPIIDFTRRDLVPHRTIAMGIEDGAHWPINRQLLPVDTQTSDLSVKVGEVPTLQERIVAEADTGNDVAGAESYLFYFREEFVDGAIEHHLANDLQRNQLFRPDLGSIKDIEIKVMLASFGDSLDSKLPLWRGSVLNSLFEVLAMEVYGGSINIQFPKRCQIVYTWILSTDLQSLVPHQTMNAELRKPVELDKKPFAFAIDQGVGVHTKSLHHAKRARNASV